MPAIDLIITILAILIGSVGQLMMKMGLTTFCSRFGALNMSNIWIRIPSVVATPQIIMAIICFLISAALWMVVISKRDLSLIYPFIALSHLFIAIMAYTILHEHFGPWRIAGIVVIVIGVLILAQDKVITIPCN